MPISRDFADHHQMISDLFPNLSARAAWDQYKLSEEQLAFWEEYGYLHNIKLLETEQVEQLRKDLAEIAEADHPKHDLFYEFHSNESEDSNTVLFHSLGHWRITKGFHDALWNPRFVVAASQLLGKRAVRFWHDQLFCKPAKHGGVVAWHQDYSYWTRTGPLQHLTCWCALDDASEANGCLQYVPGSHRWPLLETTSLVGDMYGIEKALNEEQKEQFANKLAIEMPAGYGSFHHPKLLHGSYANSSDRSRRAFVLNVFADGTRANTNEVLLEGVPSVGEGNKMEGKYFPLLFDPAEV
jgi:ectoine hydroxylase-related dioxygenase (phytanoyl-CoA dioxygenase family)